MSKHMINFINVLPVKLSVEVIWKDKLMGLHEKGPWLNKSSGVLH